MTNKVILDPCSTSATEYLGVDIQHEKLLIASGMVTGAAEAWGIINKLLSQFRSDRVMVYSELGKEHVRALGANPSSRPIFVRPGSGTI